MGAERGTAGGDLWYLGSAGTVMNACGSSMASKNSFSSSSSLASPFPELDPEIARKQMGLRERQTKMVMTNKSDLNFVEVVEC